METLNKIIFRSMRILKYRKRVFGKKIGIGNRFVKGTFIQELSVIGSYNYFGPNNNVNYAIVGNFCSFGPNVIIGPGTHSMDYVTTSNLISIKNIDFSMFSRPSQIGSDVWIGSNAVILQGVTVGTGAVIGANSVVTKDVPPYAVVVGSPAVVKRFRFDSDQIEFLLSNKWWENDLSMAKEKCKEIEKKIKEGNITL
ncbi:CatB-related O-acetyltransferase [Enterococcus casseliflavus]|uniref:CatB-related O-acetyltransferase n=1 Tax=Enterococcus casseliflavus TaxID=37734 RepID=A0AAW8URY3_ENTCA|nr:CatB-related O-acetyltransferase [Enterococcus casseliflavus]MDT2966208.1 CatB-related O-acetyltransferase [Enterococcus casseliflavus]